MFLRVFSADKMLVFSYSEKDKNVLLLKDYINNYLWKLSTFTVILLFSQCKKNP